MKTRILNLLAGTLMTVSSVSLAQGVPPSVQPAPAPSQTSVGPDLPTTTNWIITKLNASHKYKDGYVQCGHRIASQTVQASMNGLIMHLHVVTNDQTYATPATRDNCSNMRDTQVIDIDLPLYAISNASSSPLGGKDDWLLYGPCFIVSTEKNDIVVKTLHGMHWGHSDPTTYTHEARVSFVNLAFDIPGEDNEDLVKRIATAFEHARDLTKAMRPANTEPF